jgi:excisionase family DNA binding protein
MKKENEWLTPAEAARLMGCHAQSLRRWEKEGKIKAYRTPHHESLDFYRESLSSYNFTLIEYAKSGSPLIHCAPFEPEPGTTILLEQSSFAALYPCVSPQRDVLTTPVKFRALINPQGHSSANLASLLTALCHSATLSYQPSRLPAPLQWANGLARLSYEDLQFSGWSHKLSKLLTLADQA